MAILRRVVMTRSARNRQDSSRVALLPKRRGKRKKPAARPQREAESQKQKQAQK